MPTTTKTSLSKYAFKTGGGEAALFAYDLLRMYSRYAERNRWQVEIVSANESELGGYKEVIARIVGLGAYSRLKFESGGHRVQRVPATESRATASTPPPVPLPSCPKRTSSKTSN